MRGALDLDDVGAHGAQATRHVWTRQEMAVVDDADTLEGKLLGHKDAWVFLN